ncbi:MAG: SpoIID/LytB domain-containing protein [Clostridia bacterium]|nr:SpoIID/LytB domain-containing protein [Clostridia bacterium]
MYKRGIAWMIVISMLISQGFLFISAFAETGLKSAPLNMGGARDGIVRVRLSSLGNPASLKLTVSGSYTVNGSALSNGSTATVSFNRSAGQLSLTVNGVTSGMGASFRLARQAGGVKIAQGREPGNVYPGDIQFTVQGATLYVVAYVYIEDYLYGVLPYEMGNSSGLEALKAQAVAARTYTLNAMQNASSLYDLVDTTADQMYSGTPSGNENCRKAVDDTAGVAIKNGNEYTATYYTASNGGQTETVKNAWNVSGPAYLAIKDDPYDLSNPDSRVNTVRVSASNPQSSKMGALLNKKAAAAFGTGATVTTVYAVTPHTPKYAYPSRLYTKMDFEVGYTLNGESAAGILTFDIFSELESALGMSINTGKNELWSVSQSGDTFIISARRYGHGVGMSQRGAMQMARMGYTYDQILEFYYPGCVRVLYTLDDQPLIPAATPQPVQVTPEPVSDAPAPQTQAPAPVAEAWVNTESGSLNLRSEPKSSARVLCAIPQYETISVYDRGDTWCKTAYGGYEGYVMTRYLSFTERVETPVATPTAAAPQSTVSAQVTTEKGSLNLRVQPKSGAKVLCAIPQYDQVIVLDQGNDWSKVIYEGIEGYVMTKYLTFTSISVTPPPSPAAVTETMRELSMPVLGRVNTPLSTLNLREGCSTDTRILLEIPKNEYVTITAVGDTWCAVTYRETSGYCMMQYLEFTLYE